MSDTELPIMDNLTAPAASAEGSKKRKRTGKDRKEAKALAEQAQARMAEIIAAAEKEAPSAPTPEESKAKDEKGVAGDAVNAQAEEDAAKKAAAAAAKREPESIAGRIPQALKAIHPLLKQAKTFETQRLIKKIKWSRIKGEDVPDLESQHAALSDIDLHDLATSHLRTKIAKHHLFKHQPLPSLISHALPPPTKSSDQGTSANAAARAKAENRLISAKVVADGMKDILSWTLGEQGARLLSRPMALKAEKEKKKGKGMDAGRKRALEAMEVESGSEGDDEDGADVGGEVEGTVGSESEDEVDEEGLAVDAAGWESGSVDDIDNGDDDDDDESDQSDDDDESDQSDEDAEDSDDSAAVVPPKRVKITAPKPSKAPPTSTKPSPAVKPTTAKPAKPAKPEKAKREKREDITSSLFLPSLASGFIRGGSDDSDPDMDADVDGSGTIGKKGAERKNRRGQQARRAIWEKKYGKNAKHVVKATAAENVAQAEANIKNAYGKRAAVAAPPAGTASSATGKAPGRRTPAARPATYTPKPASMSAPTTTTTATAIAPAAQGQGLHPSWEAARRKKQLLAAAPAAQKIVFD